MENKVFRNLYILLICSLLLGGCASVTRGTTDTLVVNTTPSGALVRLSNGMSQLSPATFVLPRKSGALVTIEKEGYETSTVNVVSQIDGAGGAGMAGNVLVGGLVGMAVDSATGAMKSLVPNPVNVTLVKKVETPSNRLVENNLELAQSKSFQNGNTIIGAWCNRPESEFEAASSVIKIILTDQGLLRLEGYSSEQLVMARTLSEVGDNIYSEGDLKYRIVPVTGNLQVLATSGLQTLLARLTDAKKRCD